MDDEHHNFSNHHFIEEVNLNINFGNILPLPPNSRKNQKFFRVKHRFFGLNFLFFSYAPIGAYNRHGG